MIASYVTGTHDLPYIYFKLRSREFYYLTNFCHNRVNGIIIIIFW